MPQNPSALRIGTRGSKLALAQAGMVRDALRARGADCELVTLKTTGDRIQDRPLAAAGGKGLFVKELEEALLDRRIDLAVHSMKDVPVVLPPRLCIAALPPREDARDAFLSHKARSLAELPKDARVGTSSVRRQAQVARVRPDVEIVSLRGNVDTRLAKLDAGEFDAILLACAGLARLGVLDRATAILSLQEWLPALSQGAIGIETRADDEHTNSAVRVLNDLSTAVALACERAFQAALDGSCLTPIGGHATFSDGWLKFRGEVIAPDGSGFGDTGLEQTLGADPEREAAELGRDVGLALKPRVLQWLVR
ncbi:MAG TPA: hydroxymethylbilane synthase [Rhizomicrobium sp.]|jgi:hydroxymethylbilane synthase|nr:hydroxymethylbilane synthase [Rhizomicrobium sp.]